MCNAHKDAKLHLTVVFNKHKTKVLFAEADNHFTDTLLSFLTLPLGRLVRILQKHYGDDAPVIGSINSLYNSLTNLDSSYFWTERCKQMLLDPVGKCSDECSMLKLDISDSHPNRYFLCENYDCIWQKPINLGLYYGTARCKCGKAMSREVKVKDVNPGGAFTVNKASFLITDDFQIFPNVTASAIQLVSKLGIEEKEWGERMNVTFGLDEVMDLLKASIFSLTPLTDIVLKKGKCGSVIPGFEPGALPHQIEEKTGGRYCVLKAIIQKSTNRLLFVESGEHFVDFLFSLLTIPLGGIEHFLGGITPFFKNINNLHRSVADAIDGKYFEFDHIKSRLTQLHNLPYGYCSDHQIFSIYTDYTQPDVYYFENRSLGVEYVSRSWVRGSSRNSVSYDDSPKPEKSYVRRSGMFKITDDLTVRPLSALDGLNVPLSDVAEQEVTIQVDQAFSILMASLTSRSVLSTALGPILMKKPKQEL